MAAGSYALTFGPWIDDVRRTSGMDPVIIERSMSQQDTNNKFLLKNCVCGFQMLRKKNINNVVTPRFKTT